MENVEEIVFEGISEISITELNDNFSIKVKYLDGGVLSFYVDKFVESNKLWDIIRNYIENNNLSSILNCYPLKEGDNRHSEIRSQDGNSKMSLQIYERRYKVIFKEIINKYIDDRSNFFAGIDMSYLEIGNSNSNCLYHKYDDRVKLVLASNGAGEIIEYDKDFLRELLLYKFSLMGNKASMMVISDKDKSLSSYVIHCGDMVVTCPKNSNYAFVVDIVNEHNESLKEGKSR